MRGILLDIEGTTTPIRFVYETLFPYARARLETFLVGRAGAPEIGEIIRSLKAEYDREAADADGLPPWGGPEGALAYSSWSMDHDRKSTALKRLQGIIWQEGYGEGALHGEVFSDVPVALERWRKNGMDVRIFSSGSVLAQKLIFSSTPAGDLTRFLNGYFDTETGPKAEPSSYTRIARMFGLDPPEILFISDVTRELDAALAAGLETRLAVRPGNPDQPPGNHRVISTFDEIA